VARSLTGTLDMQKKEQKGLPLSIYNFMDVPFGLWFAINLCMVPSSLLHKHCERSVMLKNGLPRF